MKTVVLNYTGTVGKTTLTVNLLKRRMPDAEIIAVESINETAGDLGLEIKQIAGDKFRDVFTRLLRTNHAIVDVGASNIEDFLDGMARYEDSSAEVDCFLIPVTSGTKEQKETLAMFKALLQLGVDPARIKIVFNRVQSDVVSEFEILFKYARTDPQLVLDPRAAVMENELFDLLGQRQTTLQAVLADTTDYRTLIRQLDPETEEKLLGQYIRAYTMRSLAMTVHRNLDEAFNTLFGGAA